MENKPNNQSAQEVDVEKLAEERFKDYFDGGEPTPEQIADKEIGKGDFIAGFKACQALQSKAVGYSEEDMRKAIRKARATDMAEDGIKEEFMFTDEQIIQSLTSTPIQTKGREVKKDIIKLFCNHDVRNFKDRQKCEKCGKIWIK